MMHLQSAIMRERVQSNNWSMAKESQVMLSKLTTGNDTLSTEVRLKKQRTVHILNHNCES